MRETDPLTSERVRRSAVGGLWALTFMLNPEIAEHMRATSRLARRIAEELGVDAETVERTELAAQIHDIGLNGVDVKILDKEAPLTPYEFDICRLHSDRGARVLRSIPCLADLAPVVGALHERYDGSGYPDALGEDAIPLESRIIAVADAFHTMTMPQHWREAISPFSAIQELDRAAKKQFDSDVVKALIALLGHSQIALSDTA